MSCHRYAPQCDHWTLRDKAFCRGFAGFYGALHKALPVGEMFAGEEDFPVWTLENWADAEPLARTIESVSTVCKLVPLPGIGDNAAGELWSIGVEVGDVFCDNAHSPII